MKRTLWISAIVLALLSLTCLGFAAPNQEDGWAGSPLAGGGLDGYNGIVGPGALSYQTNWTATGGSRSWHGWWDNDGSNGSGVADWVPVGAGGDDGVVVEAYVEMYASQTQQTTAVFHWGITPFAAMDAVLDGTLMSNHPCVVGIRKDGWTSGMQAQASQLTQVAAMGALGPRPGTNDNTNPIPIAWNFSVGAGDYAPMNWTGGTNQANWGWYSATKVPVGTAAYHFKITATPDPYQGDGKYELDPDVIVVPDL